MIRQMREAEIEEILNWRNTGSIRENMFSQAKIGVKEHLSWFRACSLDPERHYLLIYENNGVNQGFISFEKSKNNSLTWGFYKAPDSGPGVGAAMCSEALSYAFLTLNVNKVVGEVIEYNENSIKLHAKLGFKREGVLRQQFLTAGKFYDVLFFGLLKSEWDRSEVIEYG